MSNQMLEELRGNLQRDSTNMLRSTNANPNMSVEIMTHAQGNITNNGSTYHTAVKEKKGFFFDKNMVIQRGLMKVEAWVDPNVTTEVETAPKAKAKKEKTDEL